MKNWKTTLLGALGAIAIAIEPIVKTGGFEWRSLVLAAIVAALGYFAADKGVAQNLIGSRPNER